MRRPIRITAKVEAYRAHDRACLDLELDMVRNPAEPSVGLMNQLPQPLKLPITITTRGARHRQPDEVPVQPAAVPEMGNALPQVFHHDLLIGPGAPPPV